jgi:hypothetical protein
MIPPKGKGKGVQGELSNSYAKVATSYLEAITSYFHGIKQGVEKRLLTTNIFILGRRKFEFGERDLRKIDFLKRKCVFP